MTVRAVKWLCVFLERADVDFSLTLLDRDLLFQSNVNWLLLELVPPNYCYGYAINSFLSPHELNECNNKWNSKLATTFRNILFKHFSIRIMLSLTLSTDSFLSVDTESCHMVSTRSGKSDNTIGHIISHSAYTILTRAKLMRCIMFLCHAHSGKFDLVPVGKWIEVQSGSCLSRVKGLIHQGGSEETLAHTQWLRVHVDKSKRSCICSLFAACDHSSTVWEPETVTVSAPAVTQHPAAYSSLSIL